MKWGVLILAMALGLAGCGGGEEPAEAPAPATEEPMPEGGIEPPGDPDMDLDPGRPTGTEWQIQQNNVTSSTAIPDQLSPLAFGTPLCFRMTKVGVSGYSDVTSVSLPFANGTLTATLDSNTSTMAYTFGGQSLSAYDPAQHGNNNFLWPDTMMTLLTAQGNDVTATVNGNTVTIPAANLDQVKVWWADPNDPSKTCD